MQADTDSADPVPVRIAVPRESAPGETRVALTPDAVRKLTAAGRHVAVQEGAGEAAFYSDEAYREAGAELVADDRELLEGAHIVCRVAPPRETEEGHEADLLAEGTVLLSFLRPHDDPELLARLAERGVTALSLELIPRITRAQSMDPLSAMSTLAGYKAVLIAADAVPRVFPLLMTAAGTLSPARVLVLGAGVAGLQAIATARRLGAVVSAYDIRPAVKEQVESLGAGFVELEEEAEEAAERETEGGYAVELEEDEQARQRRLMAEHVERADVVITTALVPGRPAPLLVTSDMVRRMRRGSAIVDLAAERGGNCEESVPDRVTEVEGVTIHAPTNLPAALPYHASQMYARNLSELIGHLAPDGPPAPDMEDEIVDACCVTHAGTVRFRP